MHVTRFEFVDGKIIYDIIKKVDLKEKRVLLWDRNIWIKFADLSSVTTQKERALIKRIENVDELPKWKKMTQKKQNNEK